MKKRLRIAVLMGGPSPERDVSMSTGRQIANALDPQRYSILPVEITADGRWLPRPDMLELPEMTGTGNREPGTESGETLRVTSHESRVTSGPQALSPMPSTYDQIMDHDQVDVAFIAMHGPYGEDGTMQGLLELLGIPYTGSGVLASALAMDKLHSRQIFEWHRIPVPPYISITADVWKNRGHVHQRVARELGYPCVVKPNAVGSSIGVSLVREPAALDPAVETAFTYGPVVLIEPYLPGTEITCGIVDDPQTGESVALPLIEIVPHADFYNYQAKYATGGSDHIIPARVPDSLARRAQAAAIRAYQVLGCECMARVDMIAHGSEAAVLEINTIPGMTPTSLLPDAARAAGISFPELLDRIVQNAVRRAQRRAPQSPRSI